MAPRAAEALGVGPAALPPLLLFGSADRCSTVAPQAVADAIEDDPSLRLEGSCPELFAEAIRGNADRRVRMEPLSHPPGRATYRLAPYVLSSAPLTPSSADIDASADEHADARATHHLVLTPLLRLLPLAPRPSPYLQPRVRVL